MSKLNKAGFTLAEVLITITIIGVVAAITIPTLIKNTQEKEFKETWKKQYSTLMSSYALAHSDNGGDFTGFTTVDSLGDTFLTKIKVTTRYLTTDDNMGHGWAKPYYEKDGTEVNLGAGYGQYYSRAALADGTLIMIGSYEAAPLSCTYTGWPVGAPPSCGFACVDVNGYKKPNQEGVDTFCTWITKNKLIPFGGTGDTLYTISGCDSEGYGCAAKYLME